MITFLSVFILFVLLFTKSVRFFSYWNSIGVPQYTYWKIWLTTFIDLITQPPLTDGLVRLCNDFKEKRYVGVYQFLTPTLVIRDPHLIKQVTVKDFDHFEDHTLIIPVENDPILRNSLFFLKGEHWKRVRSIISPLFTTSKMKVFLPVLYESTNRFLQFIEAPNKEVIEVEMKDSFSRLTNDAIIAIIYGIDCNSFTDRYNKYYMYGKILSDFSGFGLKLKYLMLKAFPKISKHMGLQLIDDATVSAYNKLVMKSIGQTRTQGKGRLDMMKLLMEAKMVQYQKQSILTDNIITALAIVFHGAGHDSASSLMAFVAYELAQNPDVQDCLQQEIDTVVNRKQGNSITYEILAEMKYLDMVISETLRKWPGGFFMERQCVKPYTIEPVAEDEKPILLNTGDPLIIPIFALHRDPLYFPEPEKFNPLRFSENNSVNPYMYMPFGTGPRFCVGRRYALLQAKVAFILILQQYSIVPVSRTPKNVRLERRYFQLDSKDAFWLGLKPR